MISLTDLLSITDASTLRDAANDLWTAGNNAGQGFAVGAEGANINDLADELGTLVARSDVDTNVAIYQGRDGSVVLVADVHGPWAVRVR